ncbi:MAG: hypothetical protein ACLRVT_06815 [Oscillospiraceae bacterium]
MMKRLAALALAMVLALSMTACSDDGGSTTSGNAGGTSSKTSQGSGKSSSAQDDTKTALIDTLAYRYMPEWTAAEEGGSTVYTCGSEGTYTVTYVEQAGATIADIKEPLMAKWEEAAEVEVVSDSIEQINGSMAWVLRMTMTPKDEGAAKDVIMYVVISDNGYVTFEFAAEGTISSTFEKNITQLAKKYRRANAADKEAAAQ